MSADIMADFSEVLFTIIQSEYGSIRNGTKKLARDAGVSTRTAEDWRLGRCKPSSASFIHLMANCDALTEEVNRRVRLIQQQRGTHESATRSAPVEDTRC